MISKKYKWVVVNNASGMVTFYTYKPKKIAGGVIDRYGKRIVGRGVHLASRSYYESVNIW
tara:strand:+ start:439 stop:618 length:180 start_codon:yes stop_codon:yes gene_type:complete